MGDMFNTTLERVDDTAVVTIAPLLQSDRFDTNDPMIRVARWGNDAWSRIPETWQPASDTEDEWTHIELTRSSV